MYTGHQHQRGQTHPSISPGRYRPHNGLLIREPIFHRPDMDLGAVFPREHMLQCGIGGPRGVVRAVAHQHDRFIFIFLHQGRQGPNHRRIIFDCSKQRQPHAGADAGLIDFRDQPVEFMGAGQMQALNHGPRMSFPGQGGQHLVRMRTREFALLLQPVFDHARGIGPVDLMAAETLSENGIHMRIGLHGAAGGAESRDHNGNGHFLLLLRARA